MIKVIYDDDYNIINLNNHIINTLKEQKVKQLELLNGKKERATSKLLQCKTELDKKYYSGRIEKLNSKISDLKNDTLLKEYLKSSENIIEEYKRIGPLRKIISFKNNSEKKPDADHKERHNLISRFLTIAEKYIDINIVRETEVRDICHNCGTQYNERSHDRDQFSNDYCKNCYVERVTVSKIPFYRDINRINTSTINNYEDRDNFYKAIIRFQGKQQVNFPDDIYTKLDNYFKSYNFPTSEVVKSLPLNENGRRGDTNKTLMYKALSEINLPCYYEDINLICQNYWGWRLPDISGLEATLMEDYDIFQSVYRKIKIDRKSSLNTDYILFVLLKRRNFPCTSDDFKCITTQEILYRYEETRRKVYEELEKTNISDIPWTYKRYM